MTAPLRMAASFMSFRAFAISNMALKAPMLPNTSATIAIRSLGVAIRIADDKARVAVRAYRPGLHSYRGTSPRLVPLPLPTFIVTPRWSSAISALWSLFFVSLIVLGPRSVAPLSASIRRTMTETGSGLPASRMIASANRGSSPRAKIGFGFRWRPCSFSSGAMA